MSPLRQLRLIIVGATLGAIAGGVVLRPSDDLRPVALTAIVGAVLFGLSFVLQRFASQAVPRLAPAHSSLIGRVTVTLAAALSVVLVFSVLVAPEARSEPARPNAQATVGPVPAAPSHIGAPIAPASSAGPVVPVVPTSPQSAGSPAATEPTSSAARATLVPVSGPAATPPVSPFATPPASPQSPPPSVATAAPAQSVAPVTPQPTPVSSPPSIIPTLPPLPTIRLP